MFRHEENNTLKLKHYFRIENKAEKHHWSSWKSIFVPVLKRLNTSILHTFWQFFQQLNIDVLPYPSYVVFQLIYSILLLEILVNGTNEYTS